MGGGREGRPESRGPSSAHTLTPPAPVPLLLLCPPPGCPSPSSPGAGGTVASRPLDVLMPIQQHGAN